MVAACAWLELTVGTMRRVVLWLLVAGAITAILGIGSFVIAGDKRFMGLNNLVAAGFLSLLLINVTSKKLFESIYGFRAAGFLFLGR